MPIPLRSANSAELRATGDYHHKAGGTDGHEQPRPQQRRDKDARQALSLVYDLCTNHGMELGDDELEALADMLLKIHGPDEQYPHLPDEEKVRADFTSHSLNNPADPACRRARRQSAPPAESAPAIVQVEVARLLVAANLTNQQRRQIARLHLWGYQLKKIAEHMGLPATTVYSHWRTAKRALRVAISAGTIDEMRVREVTEDIVESVDAREAYRLEQMRQRYRRPTHCPQGQEKCRRTGVCHYAGPAGE